MVAAARDGTATREELSKVLGGGVEVQSTLGRGTTFTFRLPLTQPTSLP